jgi:uncharacterized protein (DUF1786 family)
MKLNGKNGKRVIVGGSVAVGIPAIFLINFFMDLHKTVIATDARATTNQKQLEQLNEMPEQVGRIDERVNDLKEDFTDFRDEQRTFNGKVDDKMDKILQAVMK